MKTGTATIAIVVLTGFGMTVGASWGHIPSPLSPAGEHLAPMPPGALASVESTAAGAVGRDANSSHGQSELVDWAVSRFLDAGLVLPEVSFLFHDHARSCHGRAGLYDEAAKSVHLCLRNRHTILHELAHAWAHHNLGDGDRLAFVELRQLDGWGEHSLDWAERGTEHAAEVMAWALMEHNTLVPWPTWDHGETRATWRLLSIEASGPDELVAAYELLTGGLPVDRLRDDPRHYVESASLSPESARDSGEFNPPTG